MWRDDSRGRQGERGFSLIELGIVIAVIAVLCGVVITGAGFLRASKERATMDLVMSIKKASQQFAQRHQSGLSYGESNSPNDPNNATIIGLKAENFLPNDLATPWESQPTAGDILVFPNGTANPQICGGFACIEIQVQVPTTECVVINGTPPPLVTGLQNVSVVTPTCNGTTLDVVMR